MNLDKLKQAEEAFLAKYPGGFANPDLMAIRNRKHRPDQMIALVRQSFSKANFMSPEQIVQNMLTVITRSSVVSVFEKARFRDFALTLSPHQIYLLSSGLEELLYGNERSGFDRVLASLEEGKLAKWTLMTVCQTYFHPQRDVFIKPSTVKGVIAYFELQGLAYRPMPSWAFYEAYRAAFHEMKAHVDPSLTPTNPAFSGFLLMSIHRMRF
jgi:hypothetical protein